MPPKPRQSTRRTKTARAGLQFPVGRIDSMIKKKLHGFRTSDTTGLVLGAGLEYIVAELLELASNAAQDDGKKTIAPRHIELGIRRDGELSTLFKDVTIRKGGVIPNIHEVLLSKKSKTTRKSKKQPTSSTPESVAS